MDKGTYIHALDNGLFTLGAPHKEGLCLVEAMERKRPLKRIYFMTFIHLAKSNLKGINPLHLLFPFFLP